MIRHSLFVVLLPIFVVVPLRPKAQQTSTVFLSNSGAFTNTQMNEYVQSLLNSCSPAAEWAAGNGGYTTDGVTGCVATPSGSAVTNSNAVAGYVNNSSTATNAVGGYFSARCLANGTKCWGANPVVKDSTGLSGGTMIGMEVDVNLNNTTYAGVNGILISGLFGASPTSGNVTGVFVAQPLGTNRQWTNDFTCAQGSTSGACLLAGALSDSNGVTSTPVQFLGRDSGGTLHTSQIQGGPNGELQLYPASGLPVQFYGNTQMQSSSVMVPPIANIGSLAACSSGTEGAHAVANNCNAACSAGGDCTSGGSTHCEVYCNGTSYVETGR
jgi:hypothetical protein